MNQGRARRITAGRAGLSGNLPYAGNRKEQLHTWTVGDLHPPGWTAKAAPGNYSTARSRVVRWTSRQRRPT